MAAKRLFPLAGSVITVCAAVAAWLTGGALTFTAFHPDANARLGILPSPVWLAAWMLVAFIARAAMRSRPHRFGLLALSLVLVAPWTPVTVPPAIYIWAGPLRIWLWVVVIVGLVAPAIVSHPPRTLARVARDPRRAPWLAAAAAALVYAIGAYQIFPRLPTGDEPHYLVITQSLLRDHDLKIENNHRRGDYREYYNQKLSPDYLRRGLNDVLYS